ncbi:hypothetical protein [Erythrobacter sp. MTPC3]|uniref:hypothetical protein n=1 Tax=Erythrobacter sp. MTPC3 TaxID=3056564 RepID=UPI0036F21D43
MTAGGHIGRLAISGAIGLMVSAAVGVHALSALSTKSAPETATALFPLNGEAYEVAAFKAFTDAASRGQSLKQAAQGARELSLSALKRDPASVKSHALLALADGDAGPQEDVLTLASRLNRRDLTLQGLVLESHLAANEVDRSISSLDEILRVHPTYHSEFFPILGEALLDDRTVPTFSALLDGTSPWHEFFFTAYAVKQQPLLPNLAQLRLRRDLVDAEFDRTLIAGLIKIGEVETAAEVFAVVGGSNGTGPVTGALSWSAEFPPFDWQFTNESDFRAQESRDGARLELFARPGQGGIIAQRILPVPAAPFAIELTQTAETASRADAVRIELRCPGDSEPFFVQALGDGANTLSFESAPACEQMLLGIYARAFTGQQTLRTELGQITITGS